MPAFYGSAQAVIVRTGVEPSDLGQADATTLAAFLVGLLTEAADVINRITRRDYLADLDAGTITAIPAGLTGIANDVAADAIRTMVATRQTPIVRIDDFAITVLRSKMLSDDVKKRLRLYGTGGIGTIGLTNRPSET